MPKFTHSEPYIYDKDKKGKSVKKWCIRYSIQYLGERVDYSICGHLFRGTWRHITAQSGSSASLLMGD